VVTEKTRLWAKKVLKEEKALKTEGAPHTVAVLYFQNKTGNAAFDNLQKGLTLMLISDLSKVKEIEVLERVKIQALTEELGLGVSGLVAPGKAPRVGRLLGVANLIGGDILQLGNHKAQLKAILLKVSTETVFGQPSAEGELFEGFFMMEKELLFNIIKYFKIEVTAGKRSELRETITNSLRALQYFFKGIQYSDWGQYNKARKSYGHALEEDPQFTLAAEAKRELDALDEKECKALRNKLLDTIRRR